MKCAHSWHFDFFKGRKFRFSLDKIARARSEPLPRSQSDAEALADRVRSEIRLGTFRPPNAPEPAAAPDGRLTLNDVLDRYLKEYVNVPSRRERAGKEIGYQVGTLRRVEIPAAHGSVIALGLKFLDEITSADVEQVRQTRRRENARLALVLAERTRQSQQPAAVPAVAADKPAKRERTPGEKGGEVGINRLLMRLRAVFGWAIEQGISERTPFKRGDKVIVHLTPERPRERRLDESADARQPGEEDRLLAAAGPHLRGLIIAGIATGCRLGELLALQWKDVKVSAGPKGQTRRSLMLSASTTKTSKAREIPIGGNLAAVIDMRRHAPDGKEFKPTAFIFGNAAGEQIKAVRTAWRATCARAGIQGLHFHDLRREFGSRVLESGSSLVEARDLLGHANISQTSTYLQSTARSLGLAIDRKEAHEREQAARRARQVQQAQEAAEKDCHTMADCDNQPGSVTLASDPAQVTKH